ncbi:hypothetical protein C8J57DRAFT_1476432 [Mycena rebaudengoi]|nr:hypothetical protein C8J57DRAFT_1476432 [Mycena rebaudengoi]
MYQEGIEVGMDGYLSWVWTCIVQPIYVALNANGITSGRLWWCPTGDFTGLPLHAADSADTFIQSYTPTLGALLEANSKTPSIDPPHIGLVGVTHTGLRRDQELPGVEEEITKISSIAGDQYQVQSLANDQRRCSISGNHIDIASAMLRLRTLGAHTHSASQIRENVDGS